MGIAMVIDEYSGMPLHLKNKAVACHCMKKVDAVACHYIEKKVDAVACHCRLKKMNTVACHCIEKKS